MIENTIKNKQTIREKVWHLLEKQNIAIFPRPCFGRIPNFIGSYEACEHLAKLIEFKVANCVFSAPDYVLKRAREIVLEHNKVLAVATPHMRKILELDKIPKGEIKIATTIQGFEIYGKELKTKIDLIVQGSVAVDLKGNRLGKGMGYGDKEYNYLKNHNLLREKTKIITIVHEKQIFDDFEEIMNERDVKVDYILTPKRIVKIID